MPGGEPQGTQTKTKTRTKTVVTAVAIIAGAGLLAAAGVQLNNRRQPQRFCDSGPRAGMRCGNDRACQRPDAPNARCVVPQPDLQASLSVACNASSASFTATSQNIGTATAGSHIVRVLAFRPETEGGIVLVEETIPSLAVGPPGSVWNDPISAEVFSSGMTYLQLVTDLANTVVESNETNNSAAVPLPTCASATVPVTVNLASTSPAGPSVPGLNEVLRFTVSADAASDVALDRVTFKVNTTDNSGNGWNKWQASEDFLGLNDHDFALYDASDLTGSLSANVKLWALTNEVLDDGIDGDSDGIADTDEIVTFVRFENADQLVVIPAGTTKTFVLKADTMGASSAMDDTVRFDVMDETSAVDGNEFQWDTPTIADQSGAGVPYLPVIGGTLVY